MHTERDIHKVAGGLLAKRHLRLVSCKILQSLWAGYGHICHVIAEDPNTSTQQSLILKYITPPEHDSHEQPSESHLRKILSYQIEQYFYTNLAPQLPSEIGVASCLAHVDPSISGTATAMVISDLRIQYPVAGEKRSELNSTQTHAATEWLASFHGFWWKKPEGLDYAKLCLPPLEHFAKHHSTVLAQQGVWRNGGYTLIASTMLTQVVRYLATRLTEYRSLQHDHNSEWSSTLCEGTPLSVAELAARFLDTTHNKVAPQYTTLIHGDVKSENLFTTKDGKSVAFLDFQYVGLGLGVCDLAKLFTCSVPLSMLVDDDHVPDELVMQKGEEQLLRFYVDKLSTTSGKPYEWPVFVRHWETALVDWLRFQASWGFWGNTDWLEGRVRSILNDCSWKAWLETAVA